MKTSHKMFFQAQRSLGLTLAWAGLLATSGCGTSAESNVADSATTDTGTSDSLVASDTPPGDSAPKTDSAVADSVVTDSATTDTSDVATDEPSDLFKKIYNTILVPKCLSCHEKARTSYPLPELWGMADLKTTYANLVNHKTNATCSVAGSIRVVPFKPEQSAMMKFDGDICGPRHGAKIPETEYPRVERDADGELIKSWIVLGAK